MRWNRWDDLTGECRLMHLTTMTAKIRLTAEILMEIAAIFYIFGALREARFLGLNMFIENLVRPIYSRFYLILYFYLLLETSIVRKIVLSESVIRLEKFCLYT